MSFILYSKGSMKDPKSKHLGSFLTKQGKLVIYNSFIASNFSYCPLLGTSVVHLAQINLRKSRKGPLDLYTMTIHLPSVPFLYLSTLSHFTYKWHVKFLKLSTICHPIILVTSSKLKHLCMISGEKGKQMSLE